MPLTPAFRDMDRSEWISLPLKDEPGIFYLARGGTEDDPCVLSLDKDGYLFIEMIRFVDASKS